MPFFYSTLWKKDMKAITVIGDPQTLIERDGTLSDIVRNFDLDFSEIRSLYNHVDKGVSLSKSMRSSIYFREVGENRD